MKRQQRRMNRMRALSNRLKWKLEGVTTAEGALKLLAEGMEWALDLRDDPKGPHSFDLVDEITRHRQRFERGVAAPPLTGPANVPMALERNEPLSFSRYGCADVTPDERAVIKARARQKFAAVIEAERGGSVLRTVCEIAPHPILGRCLAITWKGVQCHKGALASGFCDSHQLPEEEPEARNERTTAQRLEIERWTAYVGRLEAQGKRGTDEYRDVVQRLREATGEP